MPWEEEMRQIDDPVRLRRRAANLEFGRGPARESTLAFLRNKLEKVRFALDSLLEGSGFELVWGFSCQELFWLIVTSLFGAGKGLLRPVACDQVPGARGRGQGTETLRAAWRLAA